jgi:hypothetical protein
MASFDQDSKQSGEASCLTNSHNNRGNMANITQFCELVLKRTSVPSEKELLEIWHDLLLFAHFGHIPTDASPQKGILLHFPSSVHVDQESIIFENVLSVFFRNRVPVAQERRNVHPLVFIRHEEQIAPSLLPPFYSDLDIIKSWFAGFDRTTCDLYNLNGWNWNGLWALDVMRKQKLITMGGYGPTVDETTQTHIPRESLVYLARRAGCFCLRQDAYEQLNISFQRITESVLCLAVPAAVAGDCSVVDSANIQGAWHQCYAQSVVGFALRRYAYSSCRFCIPINSFAAVFITGSMDTSEEFWSRSIRTWPLK